MSSTDGLRAGERLEAAHRLIAPLEVLMIALNLLLLRFAGDVVHCGEHPRQRRRIDGSLVRGGGVRVYPRGLHGAPEKADCGVGVARRTDVDIDHLTKVIN